MVNKKYIYLDNAATTPMDPRVINTILDHFNNTYGNASSIHSIGQISKNILEESRKSIAQFISAKKEDIIFTSSGTEADNLAIKGVAYQNKNEGNHIITSSIEHHAVLNPYKELEKEGFKITILPVDMNGLIDLEQLKDEINKKTILISIMFANNEIGTIEPIKQIGEIAKDHDIVFHTDAVQALGKIPIDVNDLNINLLSASSHKIYGPKGIGMLYVRNQGKKENGIKYIKPIMNGGNHEKSLRPSTEAVPLIAGFAKAVELVKNEMKTEVTRQTLLRDKIINFITNNISNCFLNGHPEIRLCNNINVDFSCIEGETIVISLNIENIGVSTGSACSSASLEPSHVLKAIGLDNNQANGSLRITLGRFTTEDEINQFLETLPNVIEEIRKMPPLDNWFCCGNRVQI